MELDIVKAAVICACVFPWPLRRIWKPRVIASRLGTTDGVKLLRSRRGGSADDVVLRAAPVRRHLAPAAGWICFRSDSLQKHLLGSDTEGQAERAVAIIRHKPVVAGAHSRRRRHLQCLMTSA